MEIFDDVIAVKSGSDLAGQITVTQFRWQGQDYTVVGQGRQWESETGRHVLVETTGGDRFELQLYRSDLCWHLVRAWRNAALA